MREKRKPILIYRHGNMVIAEDKETSNKGIAICSPYDEFDFNTGAMIALCRLTRGKVNDFAKLEMHKSIRDVEANDDIKVGDSVRVVDSMMGYSRYADWFVENNESLELASTFAFGNLPDPYCDYVVRAIHPHSNSYDGNVYCISKKANKYSLSPCYLISIDGIAKI